MILPYVDDFLLFTHRPRRRLSTYANASPSCSIVSASSATQPRDFGHQRKSDPKWESTSTPRHAISTHRRQDSPSSRNMPDSPSGELLGTHASYPSRTFIDWRARHTTFLGNSNNHILPPRTSLRRREVGRPRSFKPPAATQHAVVDTCAQSIQRKTPSQTRRDRMPTHGQLRLRMGRGIEREPRGSKILVRTRRTTTHYLEEAEGRLSRCREFLTSVGRPRGPHAQGHPYNKSYFDWPDLAVTCHDGGTATSMELTRHEQYQPEVRYIRLVANA
jgi:hypothetical protein